MAKAATATKEVATTGGASNLPAYLQDKAGQASGLQGLEMSDFIVPRIKLIQGTSDEPKTFDNAKQGEFWINVLDEPLGKELDFIVINNRKRYLLTVPLGGTPKGILARADDGIHWKPAKGEWDVQLPKRRGLVKWVLEGDGTVRGSGLAEFGTADPENSESNPAAVLFYDYLVYLPGHPEMSPCLLSLSRSSAKRARDLNGKIELAKLPMQGLRFRLTPSAETGAEGDYYNYQFQRSGFATEDEFQLCTDLAARYKDYRGADEEGEVAEAQGGTSGGTQARGDI